MPRSIRRIRYGTAVLGAFLVVVLAYLYVSGTIAAAYKDNHTIWGYKVTIKQVTVDNDNPRTLSVDVIFFSNPGRTAVITNALIKNTTSNVVAEGQAVPNELPVNTNMTLDIHLNYGLPPGTYVLVLLTEKVGGSWVSPPFNIP